MEKGMAIHSSILAWRIPWKGSLVGCSLWVAELDTTERLTHTQKYSKNISMESQQYLGFLVTSWNCFTLLRWLLPILLSGERKRIPTFFKDAAYMADLCYIHLNSICRWCKPVRKCYKGEKEMRSNGDLDCNGAMSVDMEKNGNQETLWE